MPEFYQRPVSHLEIIALLRLWLLKYCGTELLAVMALLSERHLTRCTFYLWWLFISEIENYWTHFIRLNLALRVCTEKETFLLFEQLSILKAVLIFYNLHYVAIRRQYIRCPLYLWWFLILKANPLRFFPCVSYSICFLISGLT